MNTNMTIANVMGQYLMFNGGVFARLAWFASMVDYNRPWDYKNQGNVHHDEYEDGGNFNYGATGKAAGISSPVLLRAAGWAQRGGPVGSAPDEGVPWGRAPYGDQRRDQAWINQGIRYHNAGCGK